MNSFNHIKPFGKIIIWFPIVLGISISVTIGITFGDELFGKYNSYNTREEIKNVEVEIDQLVLKTKDQKVKWSDIEKLGKNLSYHNRKDRPG